MKEEQNQSFDDLFKMGFEDFAPTPPSHLWDNIEKELPLTNEDEIFRNSFSNFEVEPSPVVWQNVQRRLPINLVVRRHLTVLSRIAAVLLIGMFGIMTFDKFMSSPNWNGSYGLTAEGITVPNEVNEKIVSSKTVIISEVTPKQTNTASLELAPVPVTTPANTQHPMVVFVHENNVNTAISTDISTPDNNNNTFIGHKTNTVNTVKVQNGNTLQIIGTHPIAHVPKQLKPLDNIYINDNSSLSNLLGEPQLANALNGQSIQSVGTGIDLIENAPNNLFKEDAMVNPKSFYFAIGGQAGGSRIFNAALSEQIGTGATQDLGGSLGFNVSGGYILNDQWSIETEANLNRVSQRYREIISEGERNTNVNLTYLQLPIMGKYSIGKLSSQPAKVNLMAGVQFNSMLTSPNLKTTLNGEPINNPVIDESLLAKNELSVITGIEVDFQMTDKIAVQIGTRANIGKDITQLFVSGSRINTQLGINVGASYKLTK